MRRSRANASRQLARRSHRPSAEALNILPDSSPLRSTNGRGRSGRAVCRWISNGRRAVVAEATLCSHRLYDLNLQAAAATVRGATRKRPRGAYAADGGKEMVLVLEASRF